MYTRLRTAALAGLIMGAGVVTIALLSGLLYEQAQRARDRELFPAVGRPVDVGGRMLNIYCSGAGRPAVIFERGSPWMLEDNPRAMFENGVPRPGPRHTGEDPVSADRPPSFDQNSRPE